MVGDWLGAFDIQLYQILLWPQGVQENNSWPQGYKNISEKIKINMTIIFFIEVSI